MASVPTACTLVSVPAIVASGSFLDKTSSLSATNVFSVASAGLYRVTIYAEGNAGETSPQVSVVVGYTDDEGDESTPADPYNRLPFYPCFPLWCVADSEITIAVTIVAGSATYNLYYTVEQLQ